MAARIHRTFWQVVIVSGWVSAFCMSWALYIDIDHGHKRSIALDIIAMIMLILLEVGLLRLFKVNRSLLKTLAQFPVYGDDEDSRKPDARQRQPAPPPPYRPGPA